MEEERQRTDRKTHSERQAHRGRWLGWSLLETDADTCFVVFFKAHKWSVLIDKGFANMISPLRTLLLYQTEKQKFIAKQLCGLAATSF